jgi:putative heme-binding domain-containing protein
MTRSLVIAVFLAAATALPASAQRNATPGIGNPFAGNPQAVQLGEGLYDSNCAQCHGPRGGGTANGPTIVSGETAFERISDSQALPIIKNGVAGTLMPAFAGKISDDDIWRIISYIDSWKAPAIDNPLPGNVAHGEQVFLGKGQCGTCHMVNGKGGKNGPDLSNIASVRKANSIIDALTKADHRIYGNGGTHILNLAPIDTYPAVQVTLDSGKTVSGVLVNQDSFSLQMRGDDQQFHSYDKAKLRKISVGASAMPTDYDKRLAPDEFTDLLAFLTRLGTRPAARAAAP